jgi:uncharacterized protein
MKEKILYLALTVLFLLSFYNFYNVQLLFQEITQFSQELNNPVVYTSGGNNHKVYYTTERTIPIVAVSSSGEGVVGNLTIKLIPGNNNVLINTNPFLETDIQYSANKAVTVAKLRSNYDFDRDFLFDFRAGNAQLIGGESAGAAITIATIAALQNKTIRNDTIITGTINVDGTIGRIEG